MKKNFLTLFFGALAVALVFLVGAVTGVNHPGCNYMTLIIIVLVALAAAAIGAACATPSKPKEEKKDTEKNVPDISIRG